MVGICEEPSRCIVKCTGKNPVQWVVRNWVANPLDMVEQLAMPTGTVVLELMMRLIRYSGFPSTMSGGGGGCLRSSNVFGASGSSCEM